MEIVSGKKYEKMKEKKIFSSKPKIGKKKIKEMSETTFEIKKKYFSIEPTTIILLINKCSF